MKKRIYEEPSPSESEDGEDYQPKSKWTKKCKKLEERGLLEEFKQTESMRLKLYSMGFNEEKRKDYNRKAAIRIQRYRERKKEKEKEEAGKRKTRGELISIEDKKQKMREYWREKINK